MSEAYTAQPLILEIKQKYFDKVTKYFNEKKNVQLVEYLPAQTELETPNNWPSQNPIVR